VTDDHADSVDQPTAATSSRRDLLAQLAYQPSRPHLLIGGLFLVLGLLITIVILRPSGGVEEYRSARTEDLIRILDDLDDRQARLEAESARLATLERDLLAGSTAEAIAEARRQLDALRVMTGVAPVSGPGVLVTIVDTEGQVDAGLLLDAVQELRDAGAEAIQVGQTRVVVDTWFADSEQGVLVDGAPVGDRVEIRAIGDPDTLAAAMSIPGGIAESTRTRGAEFSATTTPDLTISVTVPVTES
jgi:uncharacterized protein YlxW (UPF0749 family)